MKHLAIVAMFVLLAATLIYGTRVPSLVVIEDVRHDPLDGLVPPMRTGIPRPLRR